MSVNLNELAAGLKSSDETERCYALEDLEALNNPDTLPYFVSALQDKSARVRETAIYILTKIGGLVVAECTAPLLHSEDVALRNAASEILEKVSTEALPVLKKCLKDSSQDVRKFSLDILGKILHEQNELIDDIRNDVQNCLADQDENVAGSAIEVLGLAKDEKSFSFLLKNLAEGRRSSWLQCNIVVALFGISRLRTIQEIKNIDMNLLSKEAQTFLEMSLEGEGI